MIKRIFSLGVIFLLVLYIIFNYQINSIIESIYIKNFYKIPMESELPSSKGEQISYYAKQQIGITNSYNGSYKLISYPNGDVDLSTGVCTDVVIRALRGINIDLQKLIHEDMTKNFDQYPNYNLQKPDSNIDHRRVPNIQTYFNRNNYQVAISDHEKDYKPGDIVIWKFMRWDHIGIVSNIRKEGTNRYYIVHNAYNGTELSDWLFFQKITGHYRLY